MEPASKPKPFSPIAFLRSLPDPTDRMLGLQRKYGDTFEINSIFGPMVITGDPEAIRAFFTADPDTFNTFRPEQASPFFGETSIILVNGARHRRDRKLLAPPFNGARMRAYGAIMTDSAERAAAAWIPAKPFKMLDVTQSISLEIILRAVFGLDYNAERARRIRDAVVEFITSITSWLVFFRGLRRSFFGLGPWARFERARDRLDGLLYAEIAERRREGKERDDILSLMMSARYDDGSAMTDKELRDELLTLLFAGHETTAIGLAWAFYWLHRDPAELSKVLAEIDALGPSPDADAIAALPYLDAVCQESLRIKPIIADIPRTVVKPLVLPDRTVPPGRIMSASTIMAHNRKDLYPEPQRFRPARFLERKFSPFEFMPFGGGARRCIGSAFALYEMKIVLAVLLRSRRLRLVSNAEVRPRRRGFTMGPEDGIPMIYDGPRSA